MSTLRAVPNPVTTGQANASFSNDIYKDKLFRTFMKATLLLFSVSIFLCLFATSALAADLEHDLNSHYRDKILALRYSVTGNSQEFDSSGSPTNPAQPGPWTVYGRVKIKSISLTGDTLEIKAARQLIEFSGAAQVVIDAHQKATLIAHLSDRLKNMTEAEELWSKIFALTPENMAESAPDYWHDFLTRPYTPEPRYKPDLPPGIEQIGGNGVSIPRAIHTPQPAFTDLARKMQFQGTGVYGIVISKGGQPQQISVVRPLGLGLDEASVEAIRNWRFVPAIKGNTPVPFYMVVEVSFNLYKNLPTR